MKKKVIDSHYSEENANKRKKALINFGKGAGIFGVSLMLMLLLNKCGEDKVNKPIISDVSPSDGIEYLSPSPSGGDIITIITPSAWPSSSEIPTPSSSATINPDDIEYLSPSPSSEIDNSNNKPNNGYKPTSKPTSSAKPSNSISPSVAPSAKPSNSASPSVAPSAKPSNSASPSVAPSVKPSNSASPSVAPSAKPSNSASPSVAPSAKPSPSVTAKPTPSAKPTPHIHNYKETVETIDNKNGTHTIKTIKKCSCGSQLVVSTTENCKYKVTYNDIEEIHTCSVCNHSKKVAHKFTTKTDLVSNKNGTHTLITTKTCACGAKVVTRDTKDCSFDITYNDIEETHTCKECGYSKKVSHNFKETKEIIDNKNGTHTIETTKTCTCGAKVITRDTKDCEYDMTFDDTHEIYTCSVCNNIKKEKHDLKTEEKIVCNEDGTHTITTIKTCACGYKKTQKETKDCDYELEYDKSGETRTCKVCDYVKKDRHNLVETEVGTYGDVEITCETCGYTDFIEHTHKYTRYCTDLGANHEVLEVCDICGKEKTPYTESHHFIQAEEGSELWFCECGAEDYRELSASLSDIHSNEIEKPLSLIRKKDNEGY